MPTSRGDPLAAMLVPVVLVALLARRRRVKGKKDGWSGWLLILVLLAGVGAGLTACDGPPTPPPPTPTLPPYPEKIPSSWPPEEPVLFPPLNPTTDHQTVLNSTVWIRMREVALPCPTPTPSPTPSLVRNDFTATYMGNGHLYTHNHHKIDIEKLAPEGRVEISEIKLWDGTDMIQPGGRISLADAKIKDSGGGHMDIQLPRHSHFLESRGIQPAQRGDPGQLVPLREESVVAVPVWNGNRYEVVDLLYVQDLSGELGEPGGAFAKNSPTHVMHSGDSGGGLWFRGAVVGNTWKNYKYEFQVLMNGQLVDIVPYRGAQSAFIPANWTF